MILDNKTKSNITLHGKLLSQMNRTPNELAIIHNKNAITYKELQSRIENFASKLESLGVKKSDVIGLMLDKNIDTIAIMIATLCLGAAYIPIDPNYPKIRKQRILEDSSPNLLIVNESNNTKFDVDAFNMKELVNMQDKSYSFEEELAGESDLAYIIYTSGSTGQPKGVMIEHQSVINTLDWRIDYFGFSSTDRILQYSSLSFDSSIEEIYAPLLSGGALVLVDEERKLDMQYINNLLRDEKVTHFSMVPGLYNLLLEHIDTNNPFLQSISVVGDVLTPKTVSMHYMKLQNVTLHNGYGPTENSICSTIARIDATVDKISIGKPISNVEALILDENGKIQPIGISGELCLSGKGLARGYVGNPELTDEKFVKHPFDLEKRMYKTGDLARWLPNGDIEFLGRIDNQVKIRGFRVEVDEIVCTLLDLEYIKDATVLVQEEESGDKQLYAYIVDKKTETPQQVKADLSNRLPYYMIPGQIMFVDEIPLNLNGKVDRTKLLSLNRSEKVLIPPKTEVEQTLYNLWGELLTTEFGISDGFYDVGGHSLKAIQLRMKIVNTFEIDISIEEILNNSTIEKQGILIEGKERKRQVRIPKAQLREGYPLTKMQESLFAIQELDPTSTTYNIPQLYRFTGPLDVERFRNGLSVVINKHETFRLRIETNETELLQKVGIIDNVAVELINVTEEEVDEQVKTFIKPFDLRNNGNFRMKLLRISEQEHIFLFDIHHIFYDGYSSEIFWNDLVKAYEFGSLELLKISYIDYATWLSSKNHENNEVEYWKEQLRGEIPLLNLPTDYLRPSKRDFSGGTFNFRIDKSKTDALRLLCSQTDATMSMVILAAFKILLSKYSNQEDIVVGMPVLGRQYAELEKMVGMFVNTLPIRSYPSGDISFNDYLKSIKSTLLKGLDNQSCALSDILEFVNFKSDQSRNPLFDVMFDYKHAQNNVKFGDISLSTEVIENKISKFDLSMTCQEIDDVLYFDVEYATSLFKEETVKNLSNHFTNILDKIIDNNEQKISNIDILSDEERIKILYDFNDTAMDYPSELTLCDLFENQVKATPNATALIFENEKVTYDELNRLSNKLANTLKCKGISSGDRVGIMLEKSIELIASVTAILKLGAVFVPIDPQLPMSRIAYMKEASDLKLIVSESRFRNKVKGKDIYYDINLKDYEPHDDGNLGIEYTSDSLAYIIFTSGSTGVPKGVMVEHKSIVNASFGWNIAYNLKQAPVKLLQMANYTFDVFMGDYCRTLCSGSTMIIPTDNDRFDFYKLYKLITKYDISFIEVTPQVGVDLLRYVDENNYLISSIDYFVVGSDRFKKSDHDWILKTFNNEFTLINSYGITETTVDSSYHICSGSHTSHEQSISIGKPMKNVEMFVLDNYDNIQPYNVAGELYIGGPGVSKGYLGNCELNRKCFRTIPSISKNRLFKSGDVAKYDSEGNLYLLGRKDQQIKRRGIRIELGEIEKHLFEVLNTKEVIVSNWKLDNDVELLSAYYKSDTEKDTDKVHQMLKEKLPSSMVPDAVIRVESFPLSKNNKIDIGKLPKPNIDLNKNVVMPRTSLEEELLNIISETLKKDPERIGVKANFFEVGGDSLKAILLITKINKFLEVNISINDLYSNPTVMALGQLVNDLRDFISIDELIKNLENEFSVKASYKRIYVGDEEFNILFIDHFDDSLLSWIKSKLSYEQLPHYILNYSSQLNKNAGDERIAPKDFIKFADLKIESNEIIQDKYNLGNNLGYHQGIVSEERKIKSYEVFKYPKRRVKAYLRNSSRPLMTMKIPLGTLSPDEIKLKFIELINNNPALRTSISLLDEKVYYNEYAKITDIDIPYFDISELGMQSQDDVMKMWHKSLNEIMISKSYFDELLFSFVIFKANQRDCYMLLSIDHQISDNETYRVIKNHFTNKEIAKSDSYKDYIDNVYNKDLDAKKRILIKSKLYKEVKKSISEINSHIEEELMDVPIIFGNPYLIEVNHLDDPRSIYYRNNHHKKIGLELLTKIWGIIFDVKELPIRVFLNNRIHKHGNYYNTIGDFTDSIIYKATVGNDDQNTAYIEFLDALNFYRDNSIQLIGLVEETRGFTYELYRHAPLTYSFVGEMSKKDELQMLAETTNFKSGIRFPCFCYVCDNMTKVVIYNGLRSVDKDRVVKYLEKVSRQYQITEIVN